MNEKKNILQRLDELNAHIPPAPLLRSQVLDRLRHVNDSSDQPHYLRRWIMRAILGMTTTAAVALIVWMVALQPSPAYGIEGLPERLQNLKSLYIKGWASQYTGKGLEKFDVEAYVEPGGRFWNSRYTSMSGEPIRGYNASDGKRYIEVDHTNKKCTIGKEHPLSVKMRGSFDNELADLKNSKEYKKVREEKVGDTLTHVYERTMTQAGPGVKFVVWLDPATGIPVRLSFYLMAGDKEQLMADLTEFMANAEPKPGMFDFTPPAGYEVIEKDRDADDIGGGSRASGQRGTAMTRFAFDIDERAFLVCWALYERAEDGQIIEQGLDLKRGQPVVIPGVNISGPISYNHYHLITLKDNDEDFHWRWTLLTPKDPGTEIRDTLPTFQLSIKGGKGGGLTHSMQIQKFSQKLLPDIVVEAQQVTTRSDTPMEKLVTLKEIRALLDQLEAKHQ